MAGSGRGAEQRLTEGAHLQTWKLKLSTAKTVSAVFQLSNKEDKRELKCKCSNETLPSLLRTQKPWSDVGQVAHVSPTPRVTSQKVDITRRPLEAACWLRLGCWSNNVANSHPSPGPLNNRILHSCQVPQCSDPPY